MWDWKTWHLQPMLCASLTVMPNIAEASRNLPQLVRYGPIITKAWMVTSVGRFMNEASLNACIAAATELVSVSLYIKSSTAYCRHLLSVIQLPLSQQSTSLRSDHTLHPAGLAPELWKEEQAYWDWQLHCAPHCLRTAEFLLQCTRRAHEGKNKTVLGVEKKRDKHVFLRY